MLSQKNKLTFIKAAVLLLGSGGKRERDAAGMRWRQEEAPILADRDIDVGDGVEGLSEG